MLMEKEGGFDDDELMAILFEHYDFTSMRYVSLQS